MKIPILQHSPADADTMLMEGIAAMRGDLAEGRLAKTEIFGEVFDTIATDIFRSNDPTSIGAAISLLLNCYAAAVARLVALEIASPPGVS